MTFVTNTSYPPQVFEQSSCFHPPELRNREIVVALFLLPLSPVPFALDIRQTPDPGKKDTLSFYFFYLGRGHDDKQFGRLLSTRTRKGSFR